MPRYRKLYTKTVESLDLNDMPDDFHRLFWVLLPLALCREGRGLDNPAWLKSNLFPLRTDIGQEDVATAFAWFTERGMAVPYTAEGRDYFYVPTFHKYQGSTVKEAESNYPPPPRVAQTGTTDNSGPSQDLVGSKSGVGKTNVVADPSASASEYCILNTESESVPELVSIDTWLKASGGLVNRALVERILDLVAEVDAHIDALPRGSPGKDVSGDVWVSEGIKEGVASSTRNGPISFNYAQAIIRGWMQRGYKVPMGETDKRQLQEVDTWAE